MRCWRSKNKATTETPQSFFQAREQCSLFAKQVHIAHTAGQCTQHPMLETTIAENRDYGFVEARCALLKSWQLQQQRSTSEASRSEERRVGKECVSTCRSGGSP